MAGFTFRFEALLKHRRTIEDLRQRDLAQAMRHRMILETQLRGMQQTISQSKRRLGDALIGKVDVDQISHFARYAGQTTQRAAAMVRQLAEKEKQVVAAREILIEAQRDRKAIELLRDKHYRRWLHERDRRETAQMDDMALQAHQRAAVEAAI
jgi:flagellar FliJ protein